MHGRAMLDLRPIVGIFRERVLALANKSSKV